MFRNENINSILPPSPYWIQKEVMPTYIDEKHVPILWGKKLRNSLYKGKY